MGQRTSSNRIWPAVTLGAVFALLSITGAPNPGTMADLAGLGVPARTAAALLQTAPILIALAMLSLGVRIAQGRGPVARALILALSGGVIGFLTAKCLVLFAGAQPLIERLTGPLREAAPPDIAAWSLAALSIAYGVMTAALAAFGSPAMQAINFENVDAEALDVRPRERGTYAQASVGMVGQGVFVAALAVLNQLTPDAAGMMRGGAAVAVVCGALAFVWASWVIWRGMDELMRRTVVESSSWSGLIATAGVLVWAVLEALRLAPPMTAYACIVAMLFLQTFVTTFVSAGVYNATSVRKEAR